MNPITDTNMLNHHRVDYGPRTDYEPGQRALKQRPSILALAVSVQVFLSIVAFGSWGA